MQKLSNLFRYDERSEECLRSSNKVRLPSFQEWFKNHQNEWLFYENKSIYSLSMTSSYSHTDENGDMIYEITYVGWQEEGIDYGYHTVCGTDPSKPTMIYNLTKDLIVRDSWLVDKYHDCSDRWVSSALKDFFETTPTVLKDAQNVVTVEEFDYADC